MQHIQGDLSSLTSTQLFHRSYVQEELFIAWHWKVSVSGTVSVLLKDILLLSRMNKIKSKKALCFPDTVHLKKYSRRSMLQLLCKTYVMIMVNTETLG